MQHTLSIASWRIPYARFAWLLVCCVYWCASVTDSTAQEGKPAPPVRLLNRQPFDRVILNAAHGGEAIDVLLLELPNRTLPSPLPNTGTLEIRRLSEPSTLYTLSWSAISRVQLYEQLLLAEAEKLARARDLDQSYEYLSFLHKNYADLSGLDEATALYLRQDAQNSFAKQNYEETLTILLSLYDLNPQQRGLKSFVERVTDQLISQHLASRDFAAARSVLDLLASQFAKLNPSNVSTWRSKFEQGAARQLASARAAMTQEQYAKARQALRRAIAILPNVEGAAKMLTEIERQAPQIVVGVDQLSTGERDALDWTKARTSQLTVPKFVSLTGFGAEGGNYVCPWADLSSDDTGTELDLELNQAALKLGISAEVVALELLKQADRNEPDFRADFAGLLDNIEINKGNQVRIQWRRSHVRPEALLPLELRKLVSAKNLPGAYLISSDEQAPESLTYRLPQDNKTVTGPPTIIEKYYENEEVAFAELLSGEIDVLQRIPPWQLARLQQAGGITVSPYRLPTVHVLLPNYDKPIMGRREFRRALCYGIDRPQILNDILLGGDRRPGFRVLSAPLPAGITLTDPIGYAYNQGLQSRPYEPRLAAVLAAVARNSLAKIAEMRKKAAGATDDASANEEPQQEEPEKPEIAPLILAHPPNPLATTACQTIQLQLGAIGIPVRLRSLGPGGTEAGADYDLLYAELALWEPIVDARRLLGPTGIAGSCSSSMSLALYDVDQAKNWKEARSRLKEVHQIAFNDLPVIPLWQTVNHYAYRDSMQAIGSTPVTLYQNVVNWRRAQRTGRR